MRELSWKINDEVKKIEREVKKKDCDIILPIGLGNLTEATKNDRSDKRADNTVHAGR